jgi:nucleotide-binding universal stress UspA family protein
VTGRPVVVGVDASDAAMSAVRFAAQEARLRSAPLRIVHAVRWPVDRTPQPWPDVEGEGLLRSGADAVVQAAVESVADLLPADRITGEVTDGAPTAALLTASAAAQLLVVGSRGSGGVTGLLLGATASGVVAHADCPVVVLPDETAALVQDRRSVVVGVEGRAEDEEVLAFAFAEAIARETDVLAVHAWQDVVLEASFRSVGPLVDWSGVLADEQRLLSEALAGWREKEPDVPVREAVVRDRASRALVAAALTAELLVVGRHVHRTLGSATHGVVHRATCPVAVVPVGRSGGAR